MSHNLPVAGVKPESIAYRLLAAVARLTSISSESDRNTRPSNLSLIRQYDKLTIQQADATRSQGWAGLLGPSLGFVGAVAANAVGMSHIAKPTSAVCNGVGSVFSSFKEAEKTGFGAKASLVQNNFLPDGKDTLRKSHEFIVQGLFSSLKSMQEQLGRSGIVH